MVILSGNHRIELDVVNCFRLVVFSVYTRHALLKIETSESGKSYQGFSISLIKVRPGKNCSGGTQSAQLFIFEKFVAEIFCSFVCFVSAAHMATVG